MPFCFKNIPNIICAIWYVCFVCKEESSVIIYIPNMEKFEVWYVFCFWMGRKIRYKYIPYFNNTLWYVQGEKSD